MSKVRSNITKIYSDLRFTDNTCFFKVALIFNKSFSHFCADRQTERYKETRRDTDCDKHRQDNTLADPLGRGGATAPPLLQTIRCMIFAALHEMQPRSSREKAVRPNGVTRVGVTRGGNWGCHPYFFPKKTDDLFCLLLSLLLISLGCHPPAGCQSRTFFTCPT